MFAQSSYFILFFRFLWNGDPHCGQCSYQPSWWIIETSLNQFDWFLETSSIQFFTDSRFFAAAAMDDESISSGEPDLVLIRIRVPELNVEKCLQFQKDEVLWEVKQQSLAALPKVGHQLFSVFNPKFENRFSFFKFVFT